MALVLSVSVCTTIIGLPRKAGSSCCSQDAKKAFRSRNSQLTPSLVKGRFMVCSYQSLRFSQALPFERSVFSGFQRRPLRKQVALRPIQFVALTNNPALKRPALDAIDLGSRDRGGVRSPPDGARCRLPGAPRSLRSATAKTITVTNAGLDQPASFQPAKRQRKVVSKLLCRVSQTA